MKPIREITAGAIATLEQQTKSRLGNTPMRQRRSRFDFQCPTEQHKAVLATVTAWMDDFLNRTNPRWLTLLGNSGIGKTYLAKQIYKTAEANDMTESRRASHWSRVVYWPALVDAMRSGERYSEVLDMVHWPLLVLDDVFAERDSTGFASDKLNTVLGQRAGRWTVITSNLELPAIEKADGRIASRLIRDGNVCLELDLPDYALNYRNTKGQA